MGVQINRLIIDDDLSKSTSVYLNILHYIANKTFINILKKMGLCALNLKIQNILFSI